MAAEIYMAMAVAIPAPRIPMFNGTTKIKSKITLSTSPVTDIAIATEG